MRGGSVRRGRGGKLSEHVGVRDVPGRGVYIYKCKVGRDYIIYSMQLMSFRMPAIEVEEEAVSRSLNMTPCAEGERFCWRTCCVCNVGMRVKRGEDGMGVRCTGSAEGGRTGPLHQQYGVNGVLPV